MGDMATNCYRCGIVLCDGNMYKHGDNCLFVRMPSSFYISWDSYKKDLVGARAILDLEVFRWSFMASQDRLTSWLLTLGIECHGRD